MNNFSAISWREQVTFRWDEDDVHFVLAHRNNNPRVNMSLHSGHIILIPLQVNMSLHSGHIILIPLQVNMSLHSDTLSWFRA